MLHQITKLAAGLGFAASLSAHVHAHEDVAPVWSLDGDHIYFYSYRLDAAQLYRMKTDGSEQTQVTSNQFHNWWMQPISNDEFIIVSDKAEDERFKGSNLFTYSIKNDTHLPVTDSAPNSDQWSVAPSLSADKTKLTYKFLPKGFQGEESEVRFRDLKTGEDKKILTELDFTPRSFMLMPNGEELIIGYKNSLFRSDLSGSKIEKLLEMPTGEKPFMLDMALSPSGHSLVFSYSENDFNNMEIYRISIDGSHLKKLTDSDGANYGANWSPDGKELVFASYRDGNMGEVYVMAADGSHQRNITNTGQPKKEDS